MEEHSVEGYLNRLSTALRAGNEEGIMAKNGGDSPNIGKMQPVTAKSLTTQPSAYIMNVDKTTIPAEAAGQILVTGAIPKQTSFFAKATQRDEKHTERGRFS